MEREKVGMIDLTVKVPEDRVPEFYTMFGRWLSGEEARGVVPAEASAPSTREWTNSAEDIPLARTVWEKLSPHAKTLLSLLMDLPGRKISGEDLAKELGIPNGKYGIAGVLAWPGRRCAAVGRGLPWRWDEGAPGASALYWMDQEIADLFKKVRAEQRLAQNRQ